MSANFCPYCNADLPPQAARPTDRLPCPRCGELVPEEKWPVDASATGVKAGEPPLTGPAKAMESVVLPRNRKTALVVVGFMLGMALIAAAYALWTADLRRSRHPWMPDKKEEPIARRRPLELSGLRYLPAGSQFVAGLHVAEMVDDKSVGKKLLDEPRPALLDWVLKEAQRTTGVSVDGIDHIVAATKIDVNFPQLFLVVKTRTPYDLASVAKVAKPAREPLYHDRPLYRYSINPIGEALLWCVDERVLVAVYRPEDVEVKHLAGLSLKTRPLEEVLPQTLRTTVSERLTTHQWLWAVGQVDQLGPLLAWAPRNLGTLKDMKIAALGVEPVEGVTLTGHFQMKDANTLMKFKATLEAAKIEGAKSEKVEATPADAKEQWLTWQVRGEVDTVREFLNRARQKK